MSQTDFEPLGTSFHPAIAAMTYDRTISIVLSELTLGHVTVTPSFACARWWTSCARFGYQLAQARFLSYRPPLARQLVPSQILLPSGMDYACARYT